MFLEFLCAVVLVFGLVLVLETATTGDAVSAGPGGLVRWLIRGNWTAKVGGILLSLGIGALLRYLMLHVEIAAVDKVVAGAVMAAALGTAAAFLSPRAERRGLSLALTGAALAVAYLTAYSAYGFFHFVADLQALGLLFLVAVTATAVAVSRRAVSIAVLAMIGAYVAPAFALEMPTALAVYGYYVGASLVTLFMVWRRGWRPLIHLSFLFTLAGALFFGWTRPFYTPDHYVQMEPMLLALVAIHIAMPMLEGQARATPEEGRSWLRRIDQGYFLLLPLVAAALSLLLAPNLHREGALGLLLLGVLWLVAAAAERLRTSAGSVRYLGVAALLLLGAALVAVTEVPVFLLATVALCAVIVGADALQLSGGGEIVLVALTVLSAVCCSLQAIFEPTRGVALLNVPFAEHLLLGGALLLAGRALARRGRDVGAVFRVYAACWLVIACGREIVRFDYVRVAEIGYGMALLGTLVCAVLAQLRRRPPTGLTMALVGVALFLTGFASAPRFEPVWILPLMVAGQVLYAVLALQCDRNDEGEELTGAAARSALPLLILPWAAAFNDHLTHRHDDVLWTFLVGSALFASLQAQWLVRRARVWPNWLSPVGFAVFGLVLFAESLFHIEREAWDVAFELMALVYLIETARFLVAVENRDARWFSYVAVGAVASVAAAMVLRAFGPPGTLTIFALDDMLLPAIVSLLWAAIGALLTAFATRRQSRSAWSLGAVLLVAAAVKLILFDFGSLGQLGNILAMIAAGAVFLLVAWLAPFPPKRTAAPGMPAAAARISPAPPTPVPPAASPSPAASAWSASSAPASASAPPTPASGGEGPTVIHLGPIQRVDSSGRGWVWVLVVVGALIVFGNWLDPLRPARPVPSVTVVQRVRPAPAPYGAAARPPAPGLIPAPACRQFVRRLPPDYLVYVAGVRADPELAAGSTAGSRRLVLVDVNVPPGVRPVVLALAAIGPTMWRVHEAQPDQVVGVVLSGVEHSFLRGLSRYVPMLYAAKDAGGSCGYFEIDGSGAASAETFVDRLLHHPIAATQLLTPSAVAADSIAGTVERTPSARRALQILRASYFSARADRSVEVTARVQALCLAGAAQCILNCDDALTGGSSPDPVRSCEIVYRCDGAATRVANLVEGETMRIACSADQAGRGAARAP